MKEDKFFAARIAPSNETETLLAEIDLLTHERDVLREAGRKLANEAVAVLSELKDYDSVCHTNRQVLLLRVMAMAHAIDECRKPEPPR